MPRGPAALPRPQARALLLLASLACLRAGAAAPQQGTPQGVLATEPVAVVGADGETDLLTNASSGQGHVGSSTLSAIVAPSGGTALARLPDEQLGERLLPAEPVVAGGVTASPASMPPPPGQAVMRRESTEMADLVDADTRTLVGLQPRADPGLMLADQELQRALTEDAAIFAQKAAKTIIQRTAIVVLTLMFVGIILGAAVMVAPHKRSIVKARLKEWVLTTICIALLLIGLNGLLAWQVGSRAVNLTSNVNAELLTNMVEEIAFGVLGKVASLEKIDMTAHELDVKVKNPSTAEFTVKVLNLDIHLESTNIAHARLRVEPTVLAVSDNNQLLPFWMQMEANKTIALGFAQLAFKDLLEAVLDIGLLTHMEFNLAGEDIVVKAPCTLPLDLKHLPDILVRTGFGLEFGPDLSAFGNETAVKFAVASGLDHNHLNDVTVLEYETTSFSGPLFTRVWLMLGALATMITPAFACLAMTCTLVCRKDNEDRYWMEEVLLKREEQQRAALAASASPPSDPQLAGVPVAGLHPGAQMQPGGMPAGLGGGFMQQQQQPQMWGQPGMQGNLTQQGMLAHGNMAIPPPGMQAPPGHGGLSPAF